MGEAETVKSARGGSEERYRAPALDKGLDILELLSTQSGGMTRGEIVKAMDRSPSEIYRMLERLVAREYVSRSPEGDRYSLSLKLFVLAHRHPPVRRLVTRALPLMDAFSRDSRQSLHLVVEDRGHALVVGQAHCPANWEFGVRVGAEIDLLHTGSGLTLLAYQDEHAREALEVRWEGSERIAELAALEDTLSAIRMTGYRIGESQQIRGVNDITVPVLSPEGYGIAVLTCPYLERLDQDDHATIEETLELLMRVAETLSLR
ncbi:IclR family transcriptional regulator [Pelagibacterium xiamenense]|uniref:IclR family transcriptional regulator n=1 Tax=Pelagibacterium xiamenense TaxID=2901140 RepID=UPI001E2C42AB|nr:IclR family transcriptional regulator [Pelagibacterium xiamenense]MCD7058953.1 IclR family transcriptional regulator [Pelagibacterium xiamenense]